MKILKYLVVIGTLCLVVNAHAAVYGVQNAWDNPNANMAMGSIKPGYAQLAWETGTVLPVKLRNGMVTMVNLPVGEQIEDAIVGNDGFFSIDANQGGRTLYITPARDNMGSDTNMIVTGKSGNVYTFYLRSEPSNASEITYSQVDVVLDNNARLPVAAGAATTANASGNMNSIFKKTPARSNTVGVDGEDYGWIKTMKIDPSEFRFDLDIFVPNPDDYVIAPERVWRDRVFTYIDFGDKVISMTQRPVVSLLVEGGESPVGFRTDGQDGRLLIVEAVGDMVLRSGQRIVCIKKRSKPFLIADTASVMALAEANVAQSMMSGQSLNNIVYSADQTAINSGYGTLTGSPTYIGNAPMTQTAPMQMQTQPGAMIMNTYTMPSGNGGTSLNMLPTERNTAGSYLPQSNIPLIGSNQSGVAVELRSDTSVKALDEYWADLLARFSGNDGKGLLNKYKDSVFYAVDEQGVGELGSSSSAARLYRLRIGPMPDIDTAQQLCDQLLKFSGASCQVVRIQ